MERHHVIQSIADTYDSVRYLEIGVATGATFHAIKADCKVAVDPAFSFDLSAAQENNTKCQYYQESSDEYFERSHKEDFYLIFIDGLHTFEQTLRDLNNCVMRLRDTGVIIIDDVISSSYAAAISDIHKMHSFKKELCISDGAWMGDVYKVIFYIADYMPIFSYATVEENHGQTLLWRSPRRVFHQTPMTLSALSMLDYSDAITQKDVFRIDKFEAIKKKILSERRKL